MSKSPIVYYIIEKLKFPDGKLIYTPMFDHCEECIDGWSEEELVYVRYVDINFIVADETTKDESGADGFCFESEEECKEWVEKTNPGTVLFIKPLTE
jgi:hypothetical protein